MGHHNYEKSDVSSGKRPRENKGRELFDFELWKFDTCKAPFIQATAEAASLT